jgi:uncharacterized repeat protein (TIGR01451 family)
MTTKLTMRAAIALVVASVGATWCLAAFPAADISSAGPLTHVWVGNDLSCQAQHVFDGTTHEFFPSDVTPGDYGTFIAMGGVLYAPDFGNHDNTAADNTFPNIPFSPKSQTPVSGSGTTADPYKVVTVVDVGDTGLSIQQTDTYVVGDEFFTTEIMISNNGGADASGILYRAFDAFLGGSDTGYGFTQVISASDNRTEVACTVNPNNSPADKIEELIPLTGGNNYFEDEFDFVWSVIGSQMPFADTAATNSSLDNGAGISWNFSILAGQSATYSHQTLISAPGLQGIVTTKTADSPTSPAGTQNGYTITMKNPNAFPVTVSSITDTLPPGFTYAGSTTGATSSDPVINGQNLTWNGSFPVAGNGSITLHFAVTVSTIPGDYFNQAGGTTAQGYNVSGTGPTAEITVTAVSTGTTLAVSEAKGTYGGFTTITAALSSGSNPIADAPIAFKLNGIDLGTATTNAFGVAKSSAVLLVGSSYNAGTYGPAVGTGAEANFDGNASFSASYGNNKLTVCKAPLTVSAENKTRPYGFQNPPLTFGYAGFVNSEAPGATSGVFGAPVLTTTATQYSPVGSYPINIAQGTLTGGNNYNITLNPGTLTVTLCGGVIIGLNKITIGASSALVDSYNSSSGYAASVDDAATLLSNGLITLQGAKLHGDAVSSAGNVTLQSGSLVTGDVVYGTTLNNSGSVTGNIIHQTEPPFVAPIPGACGSYTAAPTTWITGAYTYDPVKGNLTVSGGGTATLAAGTYCFNNVTVSGGSTLAISGAVIINVTGKFTDSGGSLQNPSQIPSNLQVFSSYTGSNGVTVSGTSATYMAIYAPGTDVTVSGGSPFYGSLVGKTLTVSGNSAIHQDLDLPCWQ